jgi:hypothetical protein
LTVKYPQADNTGYVVRAWDEADGGILGGEGFSVQHKRRAVGEYKNERLFFIMVMAVAMGIGSGVELFASTQTRRGQDMAYCSVADLRAAYGEGRIAAWSGLDSDRVDKAIADAGGQVDGYLLSGGYTASLAGEPDTARRAGRCPNRPPAAFRCGRPRGWICGDINDGGRGALRRSITFNAFSDGSVAIGSNLVCAAIH